MLKNVIHIIERSNWYVSLQLICQEHMKEELNRSREAGDIVAIQA